MSVTRGLESDDRKPGDDKPIDDARASVGPMTTHIPEDLGRFQGLRRLVLATCLLATLLEGRGVPVRAAASAGAPDISFREPRDFGTGAAPSSAAFNAASGDQGGFLLTRVQLSDHVAVGDFDHDGRLDVAQTNVIAGSVSVFLGDGAGGFSAPAVYVVGVNPVFVLAQDLDVDGDLDLAVANVGSDDVAILRGGGDGRFGAATFVPAPQPRNIAVGNFDGDSLPDLAIASAGPAAGTSAPAGGVVILRGDRTPIGLRPAQFLTHTSNGQPIGANHVAVGDFDGRGFDDLAVGVGASRSAHDRKAGSTELTGDDVLVYLSSGTPGTLFPSAPNHGPVRVGAGPDSIAVGHFDADTDVDLAVMDSASGDITTLVGDGEGRFSVRDVNLTVGGVPRSVAAGDFDGDGVTDLVTANFHGSTISALEGNGDGTFQPAVEFWSGDATTSAAVGHFDDDRRLDVVVGRLRHDELGLLLNDSPQRGDGVEIRRDLPYGSPTHPMDDPFAAHHALDAYVPPPGTASLAGAGRAYPVVLFAHGGSGITGDKTMVGYLMRSLAREGIVAVSTDYRLGPGLRDEQAQDIAQAFRFTRDNIGAVVRCADPGNLFVAGHSAGAVPIGQLGTEARWAAEQRAIRGMVLVGYLGPVAPSPSQSPALLVSSTEGLEIATTPASAAFAAASSGLGASASHLVVPGRDHFTHLAALARTDDPGRAAILDFVRGNLVRTAGCSVDEDGPPPTVGVAGAQGESGAGRAGRPRHPDTR